MKRAILLIFIIIAMLLDGLIVNAQSFRPSEIVTTSAQMRVNMYVIETNGTRSLYDGTLTLFDEKFNNEVDMIEDAPKLSNFTNNFALYHKEIDKYLIIERRKPITGIDTMFFRIYGMQQKNFELQFVPDKMNNGTVEAYLEDMFLNTKTLINLNESSRYSFVIDGNAASKNLDRFRLVFNAAEGGPLPVTFTSVKALQKAKAVELQWGVVNQVNIKEYHIQSSLDGNSFITKGVVSVKDENSLSASYNWIDANPQTGANFYRITSIGQNGKIQYTQIVKVNIGILTKGIVIYPNPVRDGIIGLQMNNMPAGVYTVKITNMAGQQIQANKINHYVGNSSAMILLTKAAPQALYNVKIGLPDGSTTALKIQTQ